MDTFFSNNWHHIHKHTNAMAAQNDPIVYQMDVKSADLHAQIDYMEQSEAFDLKWSTDKK